MISLPRVAHFAPISINELSGMGRVAFHWREAFIRRGWLFQHYGTDEVPLPPLKPLWANAAKRAWRKGEKNHDFFLAHEPSAETLRQTGIPTVLFSHGLEFRSELMVPADSVLSRRRFRDTATRPFWLWRIKQRDLGLRRCPLLLLINEDDRAFAISHYSRRPEDIFVFRNGVNSSPIHPHHFMPGDPTVLFYGSWLERKGKSVLIQAAVRLASAGVSIRWLLVGTGLDTNQVLNDWPRRLHSLVEVIPHAKAEDDDNIYSRATVFVLPSYFEGQPLTLLQAMENGRCVIASACCGQTDIVQHDYNGLLFSPGDDDELARLISLVISNHHLRLKLGIQAKLDMSFRRWPSVADEVVDRLELLMEQMFSLG
jgi:glycosyltransferase involved in cell wall biosynthesis